MSKKANGLLFFTVLILLIIIPVSFAQDNDTFILNEQSDVGALLSISTNQSDILTSSNDYYFDASAENDGNGSFENPYRYLTDARIYDNSVIHLASGEYNFNPSKSHSNVSIYGENSIIKGNGKSLVALKYFSLNNVTLSNMPIDNRGSFFASNVIFTNSTAKSLDSYGNSYGGAIYCTNNVASINLDGCIFENTFAGYGGAIYAVGCAVDIRNSSFYNCTSTNFGGAISCKSTPNIIISKSKFNKCYSINDAGGAINIISSKINGTDLEFAGCSATFGGAMTSLNSVVYLDNISCSDNSAINGGAFYHMYGNFTLTGSVFNNNHAVNGGALFIDNSESLLITNNAFKNNTASYCAGAVFSLFNELCEPFDNEFFGNSAFMADDEYISSELCLNVGRGNYTMFKVNSTLPSQLPERYSSVEEGYDSYAKDQESAGNCWAFATLAVLESCMSKASNVTYDLSEGNMKNLMALYSDYGWNINTNDGGYDSMGWSYLTSWLGPVYEDDDPTDDLSVLSPVLNSIAHVQNIVFLYRDNYTDNDAIKQAILMYGAVGSPMAMYGSYLKSSTKAYYCYSNEQLNHAVAIVGWDDNYSKSNFAKTPSGDGAWIVKNSWGSSWADNGYCYVSYYDMGLAPINTWDCIYTFILNDTIRYEKNYQYDISGMTDYFLNSTSSVWYKNIFTATDEEYLVGVSTYFEKTTDWTVTVNVNNEFAASKSGTCNPGYFTIDLDNFVSLKAGDAFEVVFNITVDGDAGIPISEIYSLNNMAYSPNVSYASWDGVNWVDFFDLEFKYSSHWYASQVACIKAFTIKNIINTTLSLAAGDEFDVTVRVLDQYGNLLRNGNVTFNVNGIEYALNVCNGLCTLTNSLLNQTHNVITALFSQIGYNSSSDTIIVDIPKTDIGLSMNISKFLNDAVICLESSKNINATLMIKINGENYQVTFSNGSARLDLTGLENNVYDVDVICDDLSLYRFNDLSDSFIIDVKGTRIILNDFVTSEYSGALFNVTLVDEDGNVLSDKELMIVLNNSTFINRTDFNGMLSVPIDLAGGEYSIDILFNGDSDYLASNQSGNIKVKMNVSIGLDVERFVNNVIVCVSLSKAINESLTVAIGNKSYVINSTDGQASLELFNLSNGVYNINVSLDDLDNYNCSAANSTFTIDVKNTQIISGDLIITDEDDANFNITLTDEYGNALANRNISFVLRNVTYNEVTDVDGAAYLALDLDSGDYEIAIGFEGDNDYFPSAALNIIKVKTKVDIGVSAEVYQNRASVCINMSKPINESLFVIVNGVFYPVNSTDGQALLELSDLSNEDYNVSARLDGDIYEYLCYDSMFAIDVKATMIQSCDLITSENAYDSFNITLLGGDDGVLGNKELIIVLNNVSFIERTDFNGRVSIPINLTGGEYAIDINFNGDKDYFASNKSNSIKVKTNVGIDVDVNRFVNNALINVNMSSCINESLVVNVNDKHYIINSTDGKALLKLLNLSNGVYNVSVSLIDKDNYHSLDVESAFVIDVKATQIQSFDLVVDDEDDADFRVTLADENGVVLSNKNVTFALANMTYNEVTDAYGVASIPINLPMGEYYIAVGFAGDNDYFASSAANAIKVKAKVDVDVSCDVNQNNALISINVSKHVNGSLSVVVNGKSYEVNSTNGKAILELSDLSNGEYDVVVRLEDVDRYDSKEANSTFVIDVKHTRILSNDMTTYYQSGKSYTVTLMDENGRPVSGKEISFRFSNNLFVSKTDDNGQASIGISLIKGDYDIFVGFAGDNDYYGSSNASKISVKSTIVMIDGLTKTYGAQYSFKLLDINGNPLKNTKVSFNMDNVDYDAISDSNGIVNVKISKESGLCNLIIHNQFNNESLLKTITVAKRITQNNDLVMYEFSGNSYKVLILDDNGNPETAGKSVIFKVAGKAYTAKTDNNGYASLKISLVAKEYTITASYKGFVVSNKIKVKPVLTAKNVIKKKAKSYKFSAKLVNKNGKALKGKKLTFKIKGKKYTAKTNKNGVATITIKLSLKVGTYKIYTTYGKSKITNTLKIKK